MSAWLTMVYAVLFFPGASDGFHDNDINEYVGTNCDPAGAGCLEIENAIQQLESAAKELGSGLIRAVFDRYESRRIPKGGIF